MKKQQKHPFKKGVKTRLIARMLIQLLFILPVVGRIADYEANDNGELIKVKRCFFSFKWNWFSPFAYLAILIFIIIIFITYGYSGLIEDWKGLFVFDNTKSIAIREEQKFRTWMMFG